MNILSHCALWVGFSSALLTGTVAHGDSVTNNSFVGKWRNPTGTHIVEFTTNGQYSYSMPHDRYPGTYRAPTNALELGKSADAVMAEVGTNAVVVIEMSDERKRDGLWFAVAESRDTIVLVWTGRGIERLRRIKEENGSNKPSEGTR